MGSYGGLLKTREGMCQSDLLRKGRFCSTLLTRFLPIGRTLSLPCMLTSAPTLMTSLLFTSPDGKTQDVEFSPGVWAKQGSHEGVSAVREAIAHVEKQQPVNQLTYSYVLERSSQDHVRICGFCSMSHSGTFTFLNICFL